MEIVKFHISGFGHFCELESPEFSSGIHLLYGANEAGKTTLMSFFSSMFYGLRSAEYPPLRGGVHGGKVVLRDWQGAVYSLQRHATAKRKTGEFTFSDEWGQDCQAIWAETIGNIDKTVFESVFWLTHRELERLAVGQGQLAGYLYSASLGAKGIGYIESIRSLEDKREQLFKKQGKNPEINQILRQMDVIEQQHQAVAAAQEQYWQLIEQRQTLEQEEQEIAACEKQLLVQRALYNKLEHGWDSWEIVCREREQLQRLFTPEQWGFWDGASAEIEWLISQKTQYSQNWSQLEEAENELRLLEEKIRFASERTGFDYTMEQLQDPQVGVSFKDQMRDIQQEIGELEQQEHAYQRAANEVENRHRVLKQSAEEHRKIGTVGAGKVFWQPIVWSLLMVILYGISGDTADVYAWIGKPHGIVALTVTVAVWGYAFFQWKSAKSKNIREAEREFLALNDEIGTIRETIRKIVREKQGKQTEWEQVLSSLTEWERLREQAYQYRHLCGKADELRQRTQRYETEINRIWCALHGESHRAMHVSDSVSRLASDGNRYAQTVVQRFIEIYETIAGHRQAIERAEQQIRLLAYPEQEPEELFTALAETNVIQIEEQQRHVQQELDMCAARRKQVQEQLGSINHQLEQLATDDRLADINFRMSDCDRRLYETAKQWSVATIAKWALEKAKYTFEIQHQPEVLKAANRLFASLTEGRYQRIVMPIGETMINVQNASGDWINAEHLSQGTKEQLFLALRLGFLQELKKHRMVSPIFIDDILVNFDIQRLRAAIRTLIEWSREFQIFFFTCHNHVVQEFVDAGIVNCVYHLEEQQIKL